MKELSAVDEAPQLVTHPVGNYGSTGFKWPVGLTWEEWTGISTYPPACSKRRVSSRIWGQRIQT